VLGVGASHRFNSWIDKPEVAGTAEEIADDLNPAAWQRLSAGMGAKGERLYDWASCELADLKPPSTASASPGRGGAGC
jgi:SRSO17 transposase